MPKLRRPHVASPDEVKITREGDTAIFEYADPGIATTHFTMEPGLLATMTEPELLAYWNEHIAASDEFMRTQKPFTLTEIPVGKPQVEYSPNSDQWVPRGHVVRAVILTDCAIEPALDEPFVSIDDRDFTLREFFRMVGTLGGWGCESRSLTTMRLTSSRRSRSASLGSRRRGRASAGRLRSGSLIAGLLPFHRIA